MRNAKLLRTSSSQSQSVCVFCACRLSGETVATRPSGSLSYAQRRSLSVTAAAAQDNNTPDSSAPYGRHGASQAAAPSAFPDATSQARAALLAMKKARLEQQEASQRATEDAYERAAADKLFQGQNGRRSAASSQPAKNTNGNAHNTNGSAQNKSGNAQNKSGNGQNKNGNGRANGNSTNGVKQDTGDRQRSKQGNGRGKSLPSLPELNRSKQMPSLDAPIPKPEPKIQAPSWMKTPSSSTSEPTPVPKPSWGIPPARRPVEETDSSNSIPPSGSVPTSQAPSTTSSAFFGQIEASRQALAQAQPQSHSPNERSAPTGNTNSALSDRRVSGEASVVQNTAQGANQASTLNTNEERMLQQLLARKSGASAVDEPKTVSFSPFGEPDQSRGVLATLSAKRDREAAKSQEPSQPQRSFKITMSNGRTLDNSAEPFDPEISSSWSILKKASGEQQQAQENPFAERRSPIRAPEDIDAKFEEYRRRRPSSGVDLSNVTYGRRAQPLPPRRERVETRTCVRCGQEGHIARNCTNPPLPDRSRSHNFRNGQRLNRDTDQQGTSERREGGFRIRKVEFGDNEVAQKSREVNEEDEDDEGDYLPSRRGGKSHRKSVDEPSPDQESARTPRRSGRFGDDESEKPSKGRRGRSMEEDDDDDDRPSRSGRRSRFNEDDDDSELSYSDFEGARERRVERKKARQAKKDKAAKEAARTAARQARRAEELTPIRLPEFISVSNLAQTLGVRYETFVSKMEELGFTNHSHDHILTAENASLIAMEYDFDPTIGDPEGEEADERDLKARPPVDDAEFLPTRPPVVAIMGHVDHGKTTILDYLRKSSVAATEHGGITQHIGAFSVPLSSGKTITFLDTPGHAAFLEMRKRGATVTDIIVLVVAADDSVKPQTIEAIKHAKAANVPIIVAINKIDKEEANIDRVKQDLARHEVEIEDYGGDTQVVPVSGKTGQGIPELEDNISTLSEILDHRAETTGPVEGWVLEATTKKSGRVATVLVRRGTLTSGNILVAGKTWTRVRTLRNEAGKTVMSAGPGTPVEVDGWKDQPVAGDEALQAPNEQKAADVVEYRLVKEERIKMIEDMEAINETRRLEAEKRERERLAAEAAARAEAEAGEDGNVSKASNAALDEGEEDSNAATSHQTVPFIVKADVSGSVEAVCAYLLQMTNSQCSPTVLRSGVGPVSEFDIEHAAAANGHIISFNLPPSPEMSGHAEKRGVKVIEENVIYRIVDDVKSVLEEKLPPVKSQRVVGEAEVAMAFDIGIGGRKKMRIAGCKVRNGMIARGSRVRVLRGDKKVYDGVLSSLKNVKKDVQEMRKGTECGMGFENWEDFEIGDQIQTYEEKVEKRKLQI